MIGYLEGKVIDKSDGNVLILINQVGYEVVLPGIVSNSLENMVEGKTLCLHIYYHQTERQPKPVLIGFNTMEEKKFFKSFITVEAIGPLKAVKAFNFPVSQIADAIEKKDIKFLKGLNGIGDRTAKKIVATLQGKMGEFSSPVEYEEENNKKTYTISDSILKQVSDVLVNQLGYKLPAAKKLINAAMQKNKNVSNAEELFDEIYRGDNM